MLVPFSSLLTFPVVQNEDGRKATTLGGGGGRTTTTTVVLPPSSHTLCTSTFPAPSSFLPWYYARGTLSAGGRVVWIGCTGEGEAHVRATLRKALTVSQGGQRSLPTSTRLVYLDALDSLTNVAFDGSTANGSDTGRASSSLNDPGYDARATLLRLQHRLEQVLARLRAETGESEREDSDSDTATPARYERTPHQFSKPPILVVLDDVAALAWSIDALSQPESTNGMEQSDVEHEGDKNDRSDDKEDPRIKLLRDKRKQGDIAVHQDTIGHRLGIFIEERIRTETCEPHEAALLSHLTANNTSIVAPQPHTPASRGGTYGVGTGFDADDAGEENEEDELYEEYPDYMEEQQQQQQAGEAFDDDASRSQQSQATGQRLPMDGQRRSTVVAGVAAAGIDWRVDSVMRVLMVHADVWIETRGLRSGRARDCHGEICIYGLQRPCRARNIALPTLPMPADPLSTLRAQDRSARPLTQLSRLSLAGTNATSTSLRTWKIQVRCEGRDAAMLFRIEPNGDAHAWSRGAKQQGGD